MFPSNQLYICHCFFLHPEEKSPTYPEHVNMLLLLSRFNWWNMTNSVNIKNVKGSNLKHLDNKVVSNIFPASYLLPIFNFKSLNLFHEGLLKAGHCVPPLSKKLLVSLTFKCSKKSGVIFKMAKAEIDLCNVHKWFLSFQMTASSPCSEKYFRTRSSLPLSANHLRMEMRPQCSAFKET